MVILPSHTLQIRNKCQPRVKRLLYIKVVKEIVKLGNLPHSTIREDRVFALIGFYDANAPVKLFYPHPPPGVIGKMRVIKRTGHSKKGEISDYIGRDKEKIK